MENKSKKSKIMVTGGCGFIGSHLVRKLIDLKAGEVHIIDSLKYGVPEKLYKNENIKIIKFTLGTDDPNKLDHYLEGTRVVYHLAAEKYNVSKDNPRDVINSNIKGSFELLQAAVKVGVEKVVFSSSLYAYGRSHKPAYKEDETPHPDTMYGISKVTTEHFLNYFANKFGLKYIILRYLFTYGPRQYSGMGYKSVIVRNFEKMIAGLNPTLFGDGQQALDYIYVDDTVRATIMAMESKLSREIFNVGSGKPTTVNQLIDLMVKISGSKQTKQYLPPDETAGTFRVAKIGKIQKMLGFSPDVSLIQGLTETFRWIKNSRVNIISP